MYSIMEKKRKIKLEVSKSHGDLVNIVPYTYVICYSNIIYQCVVIKSFSGRKKIKLLNI